MGVRAAGAMRTKGHHGFLTVNYRRPNGRMADALVTGPGTGSTYNIRILDRDRKSTANQYLTNVPLATAAKQINVIYNYTGQI